MVTTLTSALYLIQILHHRMNNRFLLKSNLVLPPNLTLDNLQNLIKI